MPTSRFERRRTGYRETIAQHCATLDLLEQGKGLHPAEVDQFSRMLMKEPDVDLGELIRETVFVGDRKEAHLSAFASSAYVLQCHQP